MCIRDSFYADTKKEQWWGFTVNGEFSDTGVDDTKLNDGDKIVFTYNIGYN